MTGRPAHPAFIFVAVVSLVGLLVAARPPAALAADATAPAARWIYLIRHGVYDEDDPRDPEVGRALTPDGREQARLTGIRLAGLGIPIDALHASTMTRARETAEIIGAALGMTPRLSSDLKECTPPTDRADITARQSPGAPDSCRQALERDWARFFRPSIGRDSTEVIVCHGNVTRYLVARALGLDTERWLNMTIANCSISVIEVRPDGRTRLVSFADVGHLPPKWQGLPLWRTDPNPKPQVK